jgi:hypothetical protein
MENNILETTRRDFIKTAATVTGGFIVAFHLPLSMSRAFAAETTAKAITPFHYNYY